MKLLILKAFIINILNMTGVGKIQSELLELSTRKKRLKTSCGSATTVSERFGFCIGGFLVKLII